MGYGCHGKKWTTLISHIFLLDINNPLTTIFLISFGGGFKDRLLDFLEKPPDPDEGAK